jgi:hypothetical protein
LVFSDQQSMHVVELGKFRRTADADNLPTALPTPAVKRAMEVLLMLTQNELERQRYLDRLKAERDQFSYLHDAREDGLKEGRKDCSKDYNKGWSKANRRTHPRLSTSSEIAADAGG